MLGSWSSDALLVYPYSLQEHDFHHYLLLTMEVMEMLGSVYEEVVAPGVNVPHIGRVADL